MNINILVALRIFLIFTVLLGVIYPLTITGIAQFFMSEKANGSLLIKDGVIVGSTLIGQNFVDDKYFHGRFSEVQYDAMRSGASNLGPSNVKLITRTEERVQKMRHENHLLPNKIIPADMVLSSASGLDPHISLANATLQVPRVARARHVTEEQVKRIITRNTDPDFIGIWGNAGVNVLKVNIDLDKLTQK